MKNKNKRISAKEEFEMAWNEYFNENSLADNQEDQRKNINDFKQWYNNVRPLSDTGKTPSQMYQELYGDDFEHGSEHLKDDVFALAGELFNRDVWNMAKKDIKDMSKKEAADYMFRTGFMMHYKIIEEQLDELEEEFAESEHEHNST